MNDTCQAARPEAVALGPDDFPDLKKAFCEGARSCSTWEARPLDTTPDFFTLGVLVLYVEGVVLDWIDLIITDLALDSLTEKRIAELEDELGGPIEHYEVARKTVGRGHALIPGSKSFVIIRLSRIGGQI
jgi:hypothetical protein